MVLRGSRPREFNETKRILLEVGLGAALERGVASSSKLSPKMTDEGMNEAHEHGGELDPTRRDREYVFIKRTCIRCSSEFTRRISAAASSRVRLCKRCRHGADAHAVEHAGA